MHGAEQWAIFKVSPGDRTALNDKEVSRLAHATHARRRTDGDALGITAPRCGSVRTYVPQCKALEASLKTRPIACPRPATQPDVT